MRGVTKAFAEGPPAIVRVEHLVHCNAYAKQPGIWTPTDAAWGNQATFERLHVLADSKDAGVASSLAYGAVNGNATWGGTPKLEIELWGTVLFSLSLKEAGVERARVEARARPGTR